MFRRPGIADDPDHALAGGSATREYRLDQDLRRAVSERTGLLESGP